MEYLDDVLVVILNHPAQLVALEVISAIVIMVMAGFFVHLPAEKRRAILALLDALRGAGPTERK